MRPGVKKGLIGCAIGCGSLVVLAIAGTIAFAVWLYAPGDLLEPRTLLFADASGYAEWTLRLEDDGTERFVREMFGRLETLQRRSNDALPGPLGPLLSDMQSRNNQKAIRELFPLVIVWSMRPPAAEGGAERHVFSVSVERVGHRVVFADWIMARAFPEDQVVHHADQSIYVPSDMGGRAFFLDGSEVIVASDVDMARAAAERFAARGRAAPSGLDSILDAVGERPLRLAVTNQTGMVRTLWPGARDDAAFPWSDVVSLGAGGGFDGAAFTLDADLRLDREPTPDEAAALAAGLRAWMDGAGVEGTADGRVAGRSIRVSLVLDDAMAVLDSLLDDDTSPSD